MNRKTYRGGGLSAARIVSWCAVIALTLCGLLIAPQIAEAAAAFPRYASEGLTPRGTTLNLFDYWIAENRSDRDDSDPTGYGKAETGINDGKSLKFRKSGSGFPGSSSGQVNAYTNSWAPNQGLVARNLVDGYPVLSGDKGTVENESLDYLFDDSVQEGKEAFMNVGGLLTVDQEGYYVYDSTDNYAEFDESENHFWLYDEPAVQGSGNTSTGQFFPFNGGDDVFESSYRGLTAKDINGDNSDLNHYFGVSMTTNFVQQYGGHTDSSRDQAVTYNFSGDDDVWVFIDGVLVGDVGGIHGRASLEINFATGDVVVYNDEDGDNTYDGGRWGEETAQQTTIRRQFELAGMEGQYAWNGSTFADDTYHTLSFFYLERGNSASNMALKYNLVTVPTTDIVKVDQDTEYLAGAQFDVLTADGSQICHAVTVDNGGIVLLDENNKPITLDDIWGDYSGQVGGNQLDLIFRETVVPAGYRSVVDRTDTGNFDIPMYIQHYAAGETQGGEEVNLLLSRDPWGTGAYAQAKVTATVGNDGVQVQGMGTLTEESLINGRLFAIVEKRVNGEWVPVYGDALTGWHIGDGSTESIIEAGRTANAVFAPASSGAWETELADLPGRIQDYIFFAGNQDGQYRGAYYYSDVASWEAMDAGSLHRVTNSDSFGRRFSAHVYIANINNRVLLQKVDESGTPQTGATMALYRADDVTIGEDGRLTINQGMQPYRTGVTRNLTKAKDKINVDGAVVFDKLENGTYYAVETEAPDGFVKTDDYSVVYVTDDGVFADAGTADDDISVTRGVGRVVGSLKQFATNDAVDTTLYNITATPETATIENGQLVTANPTGEVAYHLIYNGGAEDVLDYVARDEGGNIALTVEQGIPYLQIAQCAEHRNPDLAQVIADGDITNLFTGSTLVTFRNERRASLEVEKQLEKDVALVGPSAGATYQMNVEFTFPNGTNVKDLTIMANVFDADGTATGDAFKVELSQNPGFPGGSTTYSYGQAITAGQTVRFYGLPDGTGYTVTEDTSGEHALPSGVTLASITNANNEEDTDEPIEATGTVQNDQQTPDHVTVTNRYDASATLEGDGQLKVTKKVAGAAFDSSLTFNYTLKLESAVGTDDTTDVSDGLTIEQDGSMVTMPNEGVSIAIVGDEASAESGQKSAAFGNMTFTKAGTYTFSVDETGDAPRYWTYDGSVKTITVSVVDDGDGTMTVTPQGNNPTFLNTYYNTDEAKSAETQQGGVVVDETGSIAGVGDTIHYEIRWTNNAVDDNGVPCSADVQIIDAIPQGTQLVDDSIASDPEATSTQNNDGTITWTFGDQKPGATGTVSFDVTVLAEAAGGNVVNVPTVLVNNVDIEANSTTTFIPGKNSAIGDDDTDGLQVGDVLTYTITYQNTTGETASMVIEDTLPDGVTFIEPEDGEGWSDSGNTGFTFTHDGQNLTWTADQAAADALGAISFQVRVNERAISVEIGNTAYVTVGNHIYSTNTTTDSTTGDGTLTVKKVVVDQSGDGIDTDKAFNFTITLTDAGENPLTRAYDATVYASDGTDYTLKIGNDGVAGAQNAFELKHGETIEITGLPEGAHYMVAETLDVNENDKGYSQAVTEGTQNGTIPVGEDNASVTFTNTYNPDSETFDIDGETGVAVTKRVIGNGESLSAAGYTFNLNIVNDATHDATGISSGALQNGKTSSDSGFVAFDDVTFTQVGIYTVTVEEVVPQAGDTAYNEHMTYDRHMLSYQIQVTNGDGELIAEVVDGTVTEGENVFTNFFYDEEDAKHAQNESGALIDGKLVGVGETIAYSIDWVNTATDQQTGLPAAGTVSVTDTLPAGVEPVADTLGNGQYDAGEHTITWTINADAAQAGTITFDVTVLPEAAGTTLTNTAQVNDVNTNSVTNVVPGKQETTDPAQIGEGTVLTYEITFTNTEGNDAEATVVDTLTKGQEYTAGSATVSVNNGEAVSAEPLKTGTAEDGETLTWNLNDLSENATVSITFSVTVTRDAGTTVDNTASVNGHNTNTTITPYPTDSKKDVFEVDEPTVSVGGKMVSVGDELVYEIDWAADGEGSMTITDTLPAGVEITTDDATGDATNISEGGSYDSASRTVTWTINQVAEGDKGTVSFHVVVTGDGVDAETGEIENEATIQIGEGNPQHVFVPVEIPTKQETGSDSADGLQVGDVLEFTIRYANTTDEKATVTVEDTLPAGLTYVEDSATSSDGFTHEGQKLTWVINEVAAGDEGTVSFSARVNENATTVENPADNTAYVTVGDNTYTTNTTHGGDKPATGDLTISKTVTVDEEQGTQIDTNKLFEFTLSLDDADGNNLTANYTVNGAFDVNGNKLTAVTNGSKFYLHHGDTATISALPDGAVVRVTETPSDGYTQTKPANGNPGAAGIRKDDTVNISFENHYRVDPGDVPSTGDADKAFNLTKQFTGRDGNAWLEGDQFSFTLTADSAYTLDDAADGKLDTPLTDVTVPMPADATDGTKTIVVGDDEEANADGIASINFGAIKYERAGVYTYTVQEVGADEALGTGGEANGITYDGRTVKITVTVNDYGEGKLVAAVAKTDEADGASFVNIYDSTIHYGADGNGGLEITKQLNNRDMTAGQFTMTVTAADDASAEKIGGQTVELKSAAAAANTAAPVTGSPFDNVTFNLADAGKTFTYTIAETGTAPAGYQFDTNVYTVSITPRDNGDGTMTVSTQVTSEGGYNEMTEGVATVPFVNTYDPDQTTVGANGSATIVAHKTLENDDIAKYEGAFTFKVTDGDTVVATGSNDAAGNITFSDIAYTSEELYKATHGGSDVIGTATMTTDETTGNEVYTFAYSVTEDALPGDNGVSYVSGNGGVTVVVTDDHSGKLSAEVVYDNDAQSIEFVNAYGTGTDGATTLTLAGSKQLVGVNGAQAPALKAGQFNFSIVGSAATDGTLAPMPESETATNAQSGAVSFGPITYTMENVFGAKASATDESATNEGIETYTAGRTKEFTYTVTENQGGEVIDGITYDDSVQTIVVTVTDEGNGKISAAVKDVSDEAMGNDDFTFVNTYAVIPVKSTPTGHGGLTFTKVFDPQSGTRQLAEGDFTFQLTDAKDTVVATGVNDANGNVAMSAIKFTQAGDYRYTLNEVVPEGATPNADGSYTLDGVTYRPAQYTVTAHVVDNHNGTLTVTWDMTNADGDATTTAEFVNVYNVDPTTVTFGAAKVLEGREVAEGEFEFELKDAQGNVVATATNDADGAVAFEPQTFGDAGTYEFTISEVQGDAEGVTYDTTVYDVVLTLVDNDKGGLEVTELTYNGAAALPVFTNTYTEPPAPVEPDEVIPATGDAAVAAVAATVAIGGTLVAAGYVTSKKRGE